MNMLSSILHEGASNSGAASLVNSRRNAGGANQVHYVDGEYMDVSAQNTIEVINEE